MPPRSKRPIPTASSWARWMSGLRQPSRWSATAASSAFWASTSSRPAHRGRGYGLLLWRAGLEHLGGRSIGLDGVVAQQANYRRSGFTYAWPNFRFGGTVESRADPQLVDARTLPFRDVENIDRPLFPGPRPSFLAAWLAMPDSRSLALVEDGTMTAFGTIRRCRSGWKVGPLYADDEKSAERVLRGLAAALPGDELFLDVPGPNAAAMRLAQRLGLAERFETARMYRGETPGLPIERIFGITSFELG